MREELEFLKNLIGQPVGVFGFPEKVECARGHDPSLLLLDSVERGGKRLIFSCTECLEKAKRANNGQQVLDDIVVNLKANELDDVMTSLEGASMNSFFSVEEEPEIVLPKKKKKSDPVRQAKISVGKHTIKSRPRQKLTAKSFFGQFKNH